MPVLGVSVFDQVKLKKEVQEERQEQRSRRESERKRTHSSRSRSRENDKLGTSDNRRAEKKG